MSFPLRVFLAFLCGLPTTLAFAPYSFWPLAIVTPFCLLVLNHKQTPKAAFLIGLSWGIGFFSTNITWLFVTINTFGGMPIIASLLVVSLLVFYLALFYACFASAAAYIFKIFERSNKITSYYFVIVPILWVCFEWIRGWLFTGFPWSWIGYSQINSPLSSLAPISGVLGVSALVMLIASSVAYCVVSKHWRWIALPVAAFVMAALLKNVAWVSPNPSTKTNFALVQGNVSLDVKWKRRYLEPILQEYTRQTEALWNADIVIWPETAVPDYDRALKPFLNFLHMQAKQTNTALLTGILGVNQDLQPTNDVIVLGNNKQERYDFETLPRYSKHHLLPFGEFVPFEALLRPLAPLFNLPQSSFSRGDLIQPNLIANGRHLLPAICFEILFPDQIRKNMTDETDFILTVSNDAWFDHTIGPEQHMEMAQMRALEFGKPVIRVTNTGVTGIIDHQGKITHKLEQMQAGVLSAEVASTTGKTPYLTLGNALLYSWGLIAFILIGYSRRINTQNTI